MIFSRISVFLLICIAFVLVSCGNSAEQKAAEPKNDSLQLKVGVYPVEDALPMLLARDWGVMDSLGLNVKVVVYKSQLDAEEALAAGKIDAALTDLFRTAWWQWQKKPVRFAFATQRQLLLVPNKVLRINKIDQLDDRMIAISRHSLDDYYCDCAVELIAKRKGQILRPQINDVQLRLSMLTSGQLDAVVLPTLMAARANKAGYKSLAIDMKLTESYAGFAYNTYIYNKRPEDMQKLESAYNIVVGRLRKSAAMPDISESTAKGMGIDSAAVKGVECAKTFAFTSAPTAAAIGTAVAWLKARGAVSANYTADTLVVK